MKILISYLLHLSHYKNGRAYLIAIKLSKKTQRLSQNGTSKRYNINYNKNIMAKKFDFVLKVKYYFGSDYRCLTLTVTQLKLKHYHKKENQELLFFRTKMSQLASKKDQKWQLLILLRFMTIFSIKRFKMYYFSAAITDLQSKAVLTK